MNKNKGMNKDITYAVTPHGILFVVANPSSVQIRRLKGGISDEKET